MNTRPGATPVRVLVVEDGHEYTENLTRFLQDGFCFTRAGTGNEALALAFSGFDAIFLDMKFDRIPEGDLLGDLEITANRFNGDALRARSFLAANQGTYILSALRSAGCRLPVVISYDFGSEPRRWTNLASCQGPLGYLPDNAGPDELKRCLREMLG